MERLLEGRKDGWLGTSVNNTVRFCFEPLAVSRLLVFHAFLQRRIPLALLYSLSASSLLHLCLFFSLFTHAQNGLGLQHRPCLLYNIPDLKNKVAAVINLGFLQTYVSFNADRRGGEGGATAVI